MRMISYRRVSTGRQAASGLGLDAQAETITAEAARRGWTLIDVVDDKSGKDTNRDGLTLALGMLARGEADGIVVAKLDRISRSLADFAGLMEKARKEGWQLVALDMGVDTTTPAGRLMVNVAASFAEYEREMISQRTKDALAQAKQRGVVLGGPRKTPVEVVARIQAEHAAGASLGAIARRLNDNATPTATGSGRWYPSTVRSLLGRKVEAAV